MKTSVSKSDFIREFNDYGRVSNFGIDGLEALYDYLTELEDDTGEELELDVIALCCDFNRYDSIELYNADYNTDYKNFQDIDELACAINDTAFITYAH
jgi:hypothetical protein